MANKEEEGRANSPRSTIWGMVILALGLFCGVAVPFLLRNLIFSFALWPAVWLILSLFFFSFCAALLLLGEKRRWILMAAVLCGSFFLAFPCSWASPCSALPTARLYPLAWAGAVVGGLALLIFLILSAEQEAKQQMKVDISPIFSRVYSSVVWVVLILLAIGAFIVSGINLEDPPFFSREAFDIYVINPILPLTKMINTDLNLDAKIGDVFSFSTPLGKISLLPPGMDAQLSIRGALYQRAKEMYEALPLQLKLFLFAVIALTIAQTIALIAKILGIFLGIAAALLFLLVRLFGVASIETRFIPKEYVSL